eukprot:TRINITY_DN17580_c0_g1_i1.p1 TRINITY_DN17580_c0_g1~~TRINITY_DN17580_c0_g1_i1.p1  ORF type:complete len:647 (+),score=125.47 TRINITY_DN17580_c0_g1_i1:44-1942(+)
MSDRQSAKRGHLHTGSNRVRVSDLNKDGALFISAHGLEKISKKVGYGGWRKNIGDTEEEEHEEGYHRVRANSAPVLQRQQQQQQQETEQITTTLQPSTVETWTYDGCKAHKQSSEKVTIHVHDEVNNISRIFLCKRDILLQEMKYFKAYLSQDCSLDDLDISVHCDVSIFKWLMEYIHADPTKPEKQPQPDPTIAVSILISSDFLQMSRLVEESLQYVVTHVQEIIKLPIDLDCINKNLIARLAGLFTYEELDKIRDRKDKIVGALFLHKIQSILKTTNEDGEERNVLFRCALCGRLFTEKQKDWAICPRSPPFITFHGESLSQHIVDHKWDVTLFLVVQRTKRLSWKEIFWRIWSLIYDDTCKVCGRHFCVAEIGHCSYHLSLPTFEVGSHVGVFPCCNTEVKRFEGGTVRQSGCCTRYHVLTNQDQKDLVMTVVAKHADVLIPWGTEAPEGANNLYAPAQNVSDNDSDTSSTSSEGTFGPDWRKRSKWSATANHPIVFAEGDTLRQSLQGNPRLPPSIPSVRENKPGMPIPAQGKRKKKKRMSRLDSAPGPSTEWWQRLGPKAKTAYQTDLQRDDDARRMQALIASLDKRRTDFEKAEKPPKGDSKVHPPKRPQNPKRAPSANGRTSGGR